MVITETTKTDGTPTMLENGADVISYTEQHPGGNGYKRHGVVLCRWHGEFVTWTAYEDKFDTYVKWEAEQGHYFPSVVDAAQDYAERGGR